MRRLCRRLQRIISIHTLLAESDMDTAMEFINTILISIHTLLAESDIMARRGVFAFTFQSTLSSQRVTPVNGVSIIVELFQSTLSSQRVTAAIAGIIAIVKFQSTLSSQRVTTTASGRLYINIFQSTLSSQRVTRGAGLPESHAGYFNPHSPRRE